MKAASVSPQVYTDFQGLHDLKRAARENEGAALKEVTRQFEAMFVQMMLKSAREAGFGDDIFGGQQMESYQGMFDNQMAMHLSKGRGIGLSDVLSQQLKDSVRSLQVQEVGNDDVETTPLAAQKVSIREYLNRIRTQQAEQIENNQAVNNQVVNNQVVNNQAVNEHVGFKSPQDFVKTLMPAAQQAAERSGISADLLLAQAALETGWGKSVIKHSDGSSSFNLFNIKADNRWHGETVVKRTLEYSDGIAKKQTAAFRSYDSFEESFSDYLEFISNSPRYNGAMNMVNDSNSFISELQKAGYATDPLYAEKVIRVLNGKELGSALSSIKL